MGASERRGLPPDLALGRSRFQAWRVERKLGERIPRPLWDLAVRLAKLHGISRTAAALGLDYYGLQRRAGTAAAPAPSGNPAFVELPAPILVGKECRLEFDNGAGATLRVQLVGYDAADVEALSRSFWNAR
jgi:hypothetical protein